MGLFAEAKLRHDVRDSLRRFLATSTGPLAVRSSSLFEDAFMQPFAGIYETVMLPNATPSLDERLLQLEDAVKRVYASTYSQRARAYASSVQNRTEAEKMAVILQPLVGEPTSTGHFHPTLAGVANSVDFYPLPHTSSSHGCAQVSLGLHVHMRMAMCMRVLLLPRLRSSEPRPACAYAHGYVHACPPPPTAALK